MLEKADVKTIDKVVVRFSGDSGDGMQLAGNIFTNVSAGVGNQVSTFPDYPAEVRAPQGSLSGVSGFQVNLGMSAYARRQGRRPYCNESCRIEAECQAS